MYGYLAPFSSSLDGNLNAGERKDASPFWMTTLFSGSEGLDREWPHDGLKQSGKSELPTWISSRPADNIQIGMARLLAGPMAVPISGVWSLWGPSPSFTSHGATPEYDHAESLRFSFWGRQETNRQPAHTTARDSSAYISYSTEEPASHSSARYHCRFRQPHARALELPFTRPMPRPPEATRGFPYPA